MVFMREACSLFGQNHPNINPLLATCAQTDSDGKQETDFPVVIFAYLNEGNLKHFLQQPKVCSRGTGLAQPGVLGQSDEITAQEHLFIAHKGWVGPAALLVLSTILYLGFSATGSIYMGRGRGRALCACGTTRQSSFVNKSLSATQHGRAVNDPRAAWGLQRYHLWPSCSTIAACSAVQSTTYGTSCVISPDILQIAVVSGLRVGAL